MPDPQSSEIFVSITGQKPKTPDFDPNEFGTPQSSTPDFDPNEFAAAPQQPEFPDVPQPPAPVAPQNKGLLQRWDEAWFNQPILSAQNTGGIYDPAAAANYYDPASANPEEQYRLPEWLPMVGGGTLRSLGAGMLEGAGNAVAGITTPLNLATMGSGAIASKAGQTATMLPSMAESAYTTAPKVANIAGKATRALSAPMMASGTARVARGLRGGEDQQGGVDWGDVGFGTAEFAGGAHAAAHRPAPLAPLEKPMPVRGTAAPVQEMPPVRPPVGQIPPAPVPSVDPISGVKSPPMANLSQFSPEGLNEMNRFMESSPEISPQQAAAEMAKPPQSQIPQVPVERTAPRMDTYFLDPQTQEVRSLAEARPGDIPLPPDFNELYERGYPRAPAETGVAPNQPPPSEMVIDLDDGKVKPSSESTGHEMAIPPDIAAEYAPPEGQIANTQIQEYVPEGVDPVTGEILDEAPTEKPRRSRGGWSATLGSESSGEVRGFATAAGETGMAHEMSGGGTSEPPTNRAELAAQGYVERFEALSQPARKAVAGMVRDGMPFDEAMGVAEETTARTTGTPATPPRQIPGRLPQFGPTREPVQGPKMPGAPESFTSGVMQGYPESEGSAPVVKGALPRIFGPTSEPRQGPKQRRGGPEYDETGGTRPQVKAGTPIKEGPKRKSEGPRKPRPPRGPRDTETPDGRPKLTGKVIKERAQKEPGLIRKILSFNKSFLTAGDFSFLGRQGRAFIYNKQWWTSIDDSVKAFGSEATANMIKEGIENHESGLFKRGVTRKGNQTQSFAEKVGLDLADHEETFNKPFWKALNKYTAVDRFSRAHTAFLNKLRSDLFVDMIRKAEAAGLDPTGRDIHLAKRYAEFINDGTGRGSINIGDWQTERIARVANDVMFAPKNLSGQIRTWNNVLNPYKYYNYDPVLRRQALRSLFAITSLGVTTSTLAAMAGGQALSPTSSDFGKIRFGKNGRIDLFGGYQQFPELAAKLILGETTPTSGKHTDRPQSLTSTRYGATSRKTVAEKFFANRLSPAASFVWAWMDGKEFDGKPFEVKRALFERTFPIVAKDMMQLVQENPAMAALLSPVVMSGFANAQVYGR